MTLLSPRTLPQAVNLVHVRISMPARGNLHDSEPVLRLRSQADAASLRAAVLALMVVPGSAQERQAWRALV